MKFLAWGSEPRTLALLRSVRNIEPFSEMEYLGQIKYNQYKSA